MTNQMPIWPPEPPVLIENLLGSGITIYKEIFGALSQDPKSPYSRISVANSSFSLDPCVGCPGRCAYCVVASSYRDLIIDTDKNTVILPSQPKTLFSGKELVNALVKHPGFLPNKSIVSIGTSSTEPFLPDTEAQTWQIMETLALLNLRNPIWVVVKMGIDDKCIQRWIERFEFLYSKQISIVFSVTYSAAPSWVEPYRKNRFRNMEYLRNAGVHISHDLRPIIRGINDKPECVRRAIEASNGLAEVICIGGLRPDPGILLAWAHIHGLDSNLLPKGPKKDLPEHFRELVLVELERLGADTPIVEHSSEAISLLLNLPDYNLYRYRIDDDNVFLSIPVDIQKALYRENGKTLEELIVNYAKSIGLDDVNVKVEGNYVCTNRRLSYQEHRLLIHTIGHANILP